MSPFNYRLTLQFLAEDRLYCLGIALAPSGFVSCNNWKRLFGNVWILRGQDRAHVARAAEFSRLCTSLISALESMKLGRH